MKLYELQHGFYASVCYKESVLEDSGHLRLQPLPRVMGVPSSARSHGSPPAAGPISPVVQANLGGQYDGDVGVDSSQMPIFNYLGFKAQEFSIDPEQNLAVYLCQSSDPDETSGRMIVRIRQMSDNAFHPFARYETLDTRSMPDELGSYLVQIFGDFVGVMFATKARFWIWNWKTGICQCELLDSGMDSFLFLSPRHFVISRRKGPLASLEVYAFKPCHYDGPPVKSCLPTRHLATFRLPRLSTGSVYFSHIELVCEPSPVFETPEYEKLPLPPFFLPRSVDGPSITPNNPSEPGPTNGPFVRPRQDDFRIALLSFTVSSLRSERNNYKMFVAVSDIYCMAKCIESNSRTGGVMPGGLGPHADPTNTLPVQVRWDDWGCRSARLLGPLGGNVWVDPAVFMNRYIFRTLEFERTLETAQWGISHSDPQDHVRSRLHVLDFNPYSVRAGSLSGRDETLYPRESGSGDAEHPRMSKDYRISGRMETDLEPTVLHSGDFAYKVISGLPYRQVTSDETFQGDLLPMMDAERILLVDDTTWGSMEVLVI
ncbi:uncharacterized protein EI90DRAFT_830135 [Cantharellus anzutake]|uniref:uncharacterized protein n=1 Tax=Cantharellus anzutake TaxID=1750568 RepID=UPI00190304C2|nr:uncharacterized protein EI90DRAFT_830135 [Cantharellus anzutake]KAF8343113.1 hypothetical protein EI90DRAFT_830135 [Cantharellus anzutake]